MYPVVPCVHPSEYCILSYSERASVFGPGYMKYTLLVYAPREGAWPLAPREARQYMLPYRSAPWQYMLPYSGVQLAGSASTQSHVRAHCSLEHPLSAHVERVLPLGELLGDLLAGIVRSIVLQRLPLLESQRARQVALRLPCLQRAARPEASTL